VVRTYDLVYRVVVHSMMCISWVQCGFLLYVCRNNILVLVLIRQKEMVGFSVCFLFLFVCLFEAPAAWILKHVPHSSQALHRSAIFQHCM